MTELADLLTSAAKMAAEFRASAAQRPVGQPADVEALRNMAALIRAPSP